VAVVLVADDSATVRLLVAAELEAAGHVVLEAEDGEQALAVARSTDPAVDVVLLDVEMPELDGFAVIAALKADAATADLPVVFLTSREGSDDVLGALRAGAHDYLRKAPDAGELLARVAAAAEVRTLRRQLAEQTALLDRLSRTDHLTGLLNRRSLDERLEQLLGGQRPHRFPLTVLLLDVDRFKAVNDELGHEAGDAVLVEVAARLDRCVRGDDVLGRWGGEEFLVVGEQAGVEGGTVLAERLREAVSRAPVEAAGRTVTVSIGGAVSSVPGVPVDALLRLADENLYDAKRSGRDRVRVTALP
jgi:diguanylate cyclase (GGDEF)-like protein